MKNNMKKYWKNNFLYLKSKFKVQRSQGESEKKELKVQLIINQSCDICKKGKVWEKKILIKNFWKDSQKMRESVKKSERERENKF